MHATVGNLQDRAQARILVVSDVAETRLRVRLALEHDEIAVAEAEDGADALTAVAGTGPDLVILGLDLPNMGGLEVMTRLRRQDPDLPVVIVTDRTSEAERVLGLELGADDYVDEPFAPRELAARVRSAMRRSQRALPSERMAAGPLVILTAERRVCTTDAPSI